MHRVYECLVMRGAYLICFDVCVAHVSFMHVCEYICIYMSVCITLYVQLSWLYMSMCLVMRGCGIKYAVYLTSWPPYIVVCRCGCLSVCLCAVCSYVCLCSGYLLCIRIRVPIVLSWLNVCPYVSLPRFGREYA